MPLPSKRTATAPWRQYQEQVADFFRELGLAATVERTVGGARGSHAVDVYVEGSYLGIDFIWVVECKSWKASVPKEKLAALSAIVQDVGAERGFLMSEKGFQSGAIRMAERSNVTLTTLADLRETVGDRHTVARVASLHLRLHKVTSKLRAVKKEFFDDEFYPPTMEPLGKIAFLASSIDDALRGDLPTPYTSFGPDQQFAYSLEEMLTAADRLLSEAEAWAPPVGIPKRRPGRHKV